MDYSIIANYLIETRGFVENSFGSVEKTIKNFHFTFVEHPFYHVIMYSQSRENNTIFVPSDIKLPTNCDIDDVLSVIDKLLEGIDEDIIVMENFKKYNPDKSDENIKIANNESDIFSYKIREGRGINYKDKIISGISENVCKKVSAKVIRILQKMTEGLLTGDDTPLKNIWDEICVQVQDQESCYWDNYLETISTFIETEVTKLNNTTKASYMASNCRRL